MYIIAFAGSLVLVIIVSSLVSCSSESRDNGMMLGSSLAHCCKFMHGYFGPRGFCLVRLGPPGYLAYCKLNWWLAYIVSTVAVAVVAEAVQMHHTPDTAEELEDFCHFITPPSRRNS